MSVLLKRNYIVHTKTLFRLKYAETQIQTMPRSSSQETKTEPIGSLC